MSQGPGKVEGMSTPKLSAVSCGVFLSLEPHLSTNTPLGQAPCSPLSRPLCEGGTSASLPAALLTVTLMWG